MLGGIGWIRFVMPMLAIVHTRKMFRGDTFNSVLVARR